MIKLTLIQITCIYWQVDRMINTLKQHFQGTSKKIIQFSRILK